MSSTSEPVPSASPLELRDVTVRFSAGRRRGQEPPAPAVDGVSLRLERGKGLALVGGSGSGKSTTAAVAARMLDPQSGAVLYDGRDVTPLRGRELRANRRHVQTIYQDPFASLDPRFTVARTVEEGLRIHGIGADAQQRRRLALEALERVRLGEEYLGRYPHQLSGGQRQRVAIAAALVLEPAVLIADEPVSMLDVSMRAGVMALFDELRAAGTAILLITHDLPAAARHADTIAVLDRGVLVEQGPAAAVLAQPEHDYTRELIAAVPTGTAA